MRLERRDVAGSLEHRRADRRAGFRARARHPGSRCTRRRSASVRSSVTVDGSTACSRIDAPPRSRPIALTMPTNAAAAMSQTLSAASRATPPAAPTALRTNSDRRRPKRSPPRVTASAPRAAPASPAVATAPIAPGVEPALGEVEPEQDADQRRRGGAQAGAREDEDARAAGRHVRAEATAVRAVARASSLVGAARYPLAGTTFGTCSTMLYGLGGHFTAGLVGLKSPAGFSFHNQTCRS